MASLLGPSSIKGVTPKLPELLVHPEVKAMPPCWSSPLASMDRGKPFSGLGSAGTLGFPLHTLSYSISPDHSREFFSGTSPRTTSRKEALEVQTHVASISRLHQGRSRGDEGTNAASGSLGHLLRIADGREMNLRTQEHIFPDLDESQSEISDIEEDDGLWLEIRAEARQESQEEPALASYLYSTILAHRSLERSLAFHMANKLASSTLLSNHIFNLFLQILFADEDIRDAIRADLKAVRERDPACTGLSHCMLYFKGYLACQSHRIAHHLWHNGRTGLALALQSRVSEVFQVDIHPAAKIGKGVLFDHATGLVIGETAEIGNNVSILHGVTLGGTGKVAGDRHPKIGDGALIGAGALILGPIKLGKGVKVGAGSVVLSDVPDYSTVVGNPGKILNKRKSEGSVNFQNPGETMDQTSFILDYII